MFALGDDTHHGLYGNVKISIKFTNGETKELLKCCMC
jgi:hypothetical protein